MRRWHYAWVIAGVTFLTMLSASAALGLPGAFLRPLGEEFGWNTEQISTALAIRFVLFGLMGPFSALFIERFGLRPIMAGALLSVAGGLGLSTQMSEVWHLILLWGVLLGLGSGLIALVLGAVVANRWFEQRRGLVLGMLTASVATGQLLFLPLATWLIEVVGWRWALMPVVLCCLLVAALVWLLVRDHPRDLGLRPFGAHADTSVEAPPAAGVAPMSFLEPLRLLRGDGGPLYADASREAAVAACVADIHAVLSAARGDRALIRGRRVQPGDIVHSHRGVDCHRCLRARLHAVI